MPQNLRLAIVGSGPAGLMAATHAILAQPKAEIHVFERHPGFGRKLLIAGSSGLNISHHCSPSEFVNHYRGFASAWWETLFNEFGPSHWIQFIEEELKLKTFIGTSDRYFVEEMKGANLLKTWIEFLKSKKVNFHSNHLLQDFTLHDKKIKLKFSSNEMHEFDRVGLFLGGGSWEDTEPEWCTWMCDKGISIEAFHPSNVGYEANFSEKFLQEAEGKPLKKISMKTERGEKQGELVITQYGIEGTPVYFVGIPGPATLDLKPDLTQNQIEERLNHVRENWSPIRRVKRTLQLSVASESLLFHHAPESAKASVKAMAAIIKKFPLDLIQARPLSEAISSGGGIAINAVTDNLELRSFPEIFCGGEMLSWDAPTGGFLIQACVSQGAKIGLNLVRGV